MQALALSPEQRKTLRAYVDESELSMATKLINGCRRNLAAATIRSMLLTDRGANDDPLHGMVMENSGDTEVAVGTMASRCSSIST